MIDFLKCKSIKKSLCCVILINKKLYPVYFVRDWSFSAKKKINKKKDRDWSLYWFFLPLKLWLDCYNEVYNAYTSMFPLSKANFLFYLFKKTTIYNQKKKKNDFNFKS